MKRNWLKLLSLIICGLFVVSTVSGCASLRKKFTRQKKKDKKVEEFVPVLIPEDYSSESRLASEDYQTRYTYWTVWYKEMQLALDYDQGEKRISYILTEMIKALNGMKIHLPEVKLAQLEEQLGKIADLQDMMSKPEHLRRMSSFEKDLNRIEKVIRNEFKPAAVEGVLVP